MLILICKFFDLSTKIVYQNWPTILGICCHCLKSKIYGEKNIFGNFISWICTLLCKSDSKCINFASKDSLSLRIIYSSTFFLNDMNNCNSLFIPK